MSASFPPYAILSPSLTFPAVFESGIYGCADKRIGYHSAGSGWENNVDAAMLTGSSRRAVDDGNSATALFYGTGASWYTATDDDRGEASVRVLDTEGITESYTPSVDCYSASPAYGRRVWTVSDLDLGWHRLVITVLHTKNALSSAYAVDIDSIQIDRIDPIPAALELQTSIAGPGVYSNKDSRIAYTSVSTGWGANTNANFLTGSAQSATDAGNKATFVFYGTGAAVLTVAHDDQGQASATVYDGGGNVEATAVFDCYSAPLIWGKAVWSVSGLPAGWHKLVIEVLGTKNALSSDYTINIDSIRIENRPVERVPGNFYGVPVIHLTDLWHPIGDDDDLFDAAYLYASPYVDLKAVILTSPGSGSVVLDQLNAISGLSVPYATGLEGNLASIDDQALGQSQQDGVDLILSTLAAATEPVNFTCVSPTRDLAAAYNRDPELFAAKAGRIFIFSGNAQSYYEFNAVTDPYGYAAMLQSDLDIWWVPCFDGAYVAGEPTGEHGSYFYSDAPLGPTAPGMSDPVKQLIIYSERDIADVNPRVFLLRPVDAAQWAASQGGGGHGWGSAVFDALVDAHDPDVFTFADVSVSIDPATAYPTYPGSDPHTVKLFARTGTQDEYNVSMRAKQGESLVSLGTEV